MLILTHKGNMSLLTHKGNMPREIIWGKGI